MDSAAHLPGVEIRSLKLTGDNPLGNDDDAVALNPGRVPTNTDVWPARNPYVTPNDPVGTVSKGKRWSDTSNSLKSAQGD